MAKILGQLIAGSFSEVIARQKDDASLEIGTLAVAQDDSGSVLLQVYDLAYGSQLSAQTREFISGLALEEQTDLKLLDARLRNYTLAYLKPLLRLDGRGARIAKQLPAFFSTLRAVEEQDLSFLTRPANQLAVGSLRSGSHELTHQVLLNGVQVLSHHVLIPAQTGKGKSNLTSCLLWDATPQDYCGMLVLDPHDEYYGRNRAGLKDHPSRSRVVYYTPTNPPPGASTLKIHLRSLRPRHFRGAAFWSDAQWEALYALHKLYGPDWIASTLLSQQMPENFQEGTIGVIRRRLIGLLSLETAGSRLICNGVFDDQAGQSTVNDVCDALEAAKTVIIDTSAFDGGTELLIGSLLSSEIFRRYKSYKQDGTLAQKPVVSIILEEAPRVLGKDALERGPNIFSTIAREGRKFKVGLIAITQLPSLIPRDILANMNTKIILGIEMAPERHAIIDSAAQDLSRDERAIAALDKGEAIITSHFTKFATPVKIPLFTDLVAKSASTQHVRSFPGLAP